MMCACGADDGVLSLIIRQMFRKLRFQMIDDKQSEGALTAQERAVLLSSTASNMLKRAKAGKIPLYRIGGSVKFDPVLTATWLRKCRTS
jgi:hypothetical protein